MNGKPEKKSRTDADRRVRQCERLARLMQLLHLISGRGRWDANALAEELGCSKRTVHRLLQTLSMASVPWYFDEKTRAYKLRSGYKFPLAEIDVSQIDQRQESESDLNNAISKLIDDGNAFSESLASFLDKLESLRASIRPPQ